MRWNTPQYALGSNRARFSFLFFPKTIGGETRWLEFARWGEEVVRGKLTGLLYWRETGWLQD